MTNQTSSYQSADNSNPSRANRPVQTGQSGSGDLKQTGRELANDAKDTVSNAKSEVKEQVSDIAHAAQDQASNFLGEQKGVAAERIGGVAQALRSAGQELSEHDERRLAQYTDSLAGQLDNFSNTLHDRDIGSLVEDAKQLAHRQPEIFVAGALAAGFVLGRFFKSSRRSSRSYQDAYREFDPRDPSRIYGEQYGQGYGEQFDRSGGYDYGRNYDSGSRTGYGQNYGQSYGQYNSSQTFQGPNTSQGSNEWSGQGSTQQSGQVTTHGVGTGQSLGHERDLQQRTRIWSGRRAGLKRQNQ